MVAHYRRLRPGTYLDHHGATRTCTESENDTPSSFMNEKRTLTSVSLPRFGRDV